MKVSVRSKLSVYEFARIMQINPLHIGQVVYVPPGHRPPMCAQAYYQYDWQDADRVGRESIATAIAEAEELIERHLGYRLAPSWEVDEWSAVDRHYRAGVLAAPVDSEGRGIAVRAKWGHFISGGIRSKDLIAADAVVMYSDEDGDDYFETATVTCNCDPFDYACELKVYHPGHGGDDAYEIRPVRASVDVALSQATIVFRREQAVVEQRLEALYPEPVDGNDDAAFLDNVDVYRVYNDPQRQASFLWEPFAAGGCSSCGGSGCSICSYASQVGCLHLRGNPALSWVVPAPAVWNQSTLSFDGQPWVNGHRPDIVRLYYYSGLRDKNQPCVTGMDEQWKRTVAHYAASLLDRPPCDCAVTQWEYWREDLSLVQGSDSTGNQKGIYRAHPDDLRNPFGTRRGQIDAWQRVRQAAVLPAAMPV